MTLYHGTCCKFSQIDFSKSKDKRDFGKGFYTTTIFTMRTIALYIAGVYTVEQAIEQLCYFKVNDQISFHSEKALKCLRWKQDREV